MRLLMKYKHKIVAFGLLPTIITLIGLHFFPTTCMLGIGFGTSLATLCHDIFQFKRLNFFLLQGTVGIGLCFLFRLFTGYEYIPPRSITPTLEFLLLIFAFIYLTAPETYQHFLKRFRLDTSATYRLETRIIVVLSGLHLLGLFLFQNSLTPQSNPIHFALVFYPPALIYLLCLTINMTGVRLAASSCENSRCMIRIAPVCNGKIFLAPYESNGRHVWDVPLIFDLTRNAGRSEKFAARKAKEFLKERMEKDSFISPRLIMKYRIERVSHRPVQLFIFPIDKEETCGTKEGRFFTFSELAEMPEQFSRILLAEKEHLLISANVWKDFIYR